MFHESKSMLHDFFIKGYWYRFVLKHLLGQSFFLLADFVVPDAVKCLELLCILLVLDDSNGDCSD